MTVRLINKEELIKIISDSSEENFMIMEYDSEIGMSGTPRNIDKVGCQDEIRKADECNLSDMIVVDQIDLYKKHKIDVSNLFASIFMKKSCLVGN